MRKQFGRSLLQGAHGGAADAGKIVSLYGFGALMSVGGGWLGDRFSPRLVLGCGLLAGAVIGYFLFHGPRDFFGQAALVLAFGIAFGGTIYVNLAACHVRAVTGGHGGGLRYQFLHLGVASGFHDWLAGQLLGVASGG